MKRLAIFTALAVMLFGTAAGTARAQTVITESTDDGAFFTIIVPEPWNGDLVIWNHGFDLDMP